MLPHPKQTHSHLDGKHADLPQHIMPFHGLFNVIFLDISFDLVHLRLVKSARGTNGFA